MFANPRPRMIVPETLTLADELAALQAVDADESASRDLLLAALQSPRAAVREAALLGLADQREQPPVLAAIEQLVADDDLVVRWQAASLLPAEPGRQSALLAELLAGLQAVEDADRWQAAEAAGRVPLVGLDREQRADLRAALLARLTDPHAGVRSSVAAALKRLVDRDTLAHLYCLLRDDDRLRRRSAVSALGLIGVPASGPHLLPYLRDVDAGVRWEAATSLGLLADNRATLPLSVALADDAAWVRAAAANALATIADPAAIPSLLHLASTDESLTVCRAATAALAGLPPNEQTWAYMHVALQAADAQICASAIRYFASHPDTEATNHLHELLSDPRTVFGRTIGDLAAAALIAAADVH